MDLWWSNLAMNRSLGHHLAQYYTYIIYIIICYILFIYHIFICVQKSRTFFIHTYLYTVVCILTNYCDIVAPCTYIYIYTHTCSITYTYTHNTIASTISTIWIDVWMAAAGSWLRMPSSFHAPGRCAWSLRCPDFFRPET